MISDAGTTWPARFRASCSISAHRRAFARALVVRVLVKEHRARAVELAPDGELALEDVPDLGEVMVVLRVVRARLVAHHAGVRLGRALGSRMEQHLPHLAGPANGLPFA